MKWLQTFRFDWRSRTFLVSGYNQWEIPENWIGVEKRSLRRMNHYERKDFHAGEHFFLWKEKTEVEKKKFLQYWTPRPTYIEKPSSMGNRSSTVRNGHGSDGMTRTGSAYSLKSSENLAEAPTPPQEEVETMLELLMVNKINSFFPCPNFNSKSKLLILRFERHASASLGPLKIGWRVESHAKNSGSRDTQILMHSLSFSLSLSRTHVSLFTNGSFLFFRRIWI